MAENIISVNNLIKKYKDIVAVDDISFDVKRGTLFAFLGENGAGKTTTINILCNVLKKTSGKVFINNFDLDKDEFAIKNSIGIVFQNSVLDENFTVIENLHNRACFYGLSKKQAKSRIKEIIELFELKDILKRKYSKLSGGQKRKVDIARALINDPSVLFLDEPTTGLDPKTRKLVWNILSSLKKKKNLTIFLTTHYMEETLQADEIVILDKGKIIATGSPLVLKSKYSSNKLIWYSKDTDENRKFLNTLQLDFEYSIDAFYINFEDYSSLVSLLEKHKDHFTEFEIVKGNMDDVFLNVTGRKLEN